MWFSLLSMEVSFFWTQKQKEKRSKWVVCFGLGFLVLTLSFSFGNEEVKWVAWQCRQ
jgi:hypothetical protein